LEKVSCPVLALNGDKDLQVPSQINLDAIKLALNKGGNTDATTLELKNINHLFQACETGLQDEYAQIEQTISPLALTLISDWVLKQID
jgi:hypothetical protein